MKGRCLCGAVSFEAAPRAAETHVCHCEMCRRWTGSALLAVAVLPEDITFEGADRIRTYPSSDWAERAWCDGCGSTLYYRLSVEGHGPRSYEMALGLFDEPDAFPVAKEIFIDRKPAAYAFAGEHPRLTEQEHLVEIGLA
jgi:hypothetical protein